MKILKRIFPVLGLLVACNFNHQTEDKNFYEPVEIKPDHKYEEIKEYEIMRETMFDVGVVSYYVYFYSTTCNHCDEIKNFMIEKALEREDVYFVKGSSKDKITNNEKLLIGAENPENFYILGYPTLALIRNKKCVKNLAGINKIQQELK